MELELLKKQYSAFSEEYDPRKKEKRIKVLFIAESPPASKNKTNPPFFLTRTLNRKRGLSVGISVKLSTVRT